MKNPTSQSSSAMLFLTLLALYGQRAICSKDLEKPSSRQMEQTTVDTLSDFDSGFEPSDRTSFHNSLIDRDYVAYMEGNHDEKPIYLFDNKFQERDPALLKEYEVPIYFREDLFSYMKEEDRPDYRWFLIGPGLHSSFHLKWHYELTGRSGTPLHQDPHKTSAWNALAQGRKRWTLYPPDVVPPGNTFVQLARSSSTAGVDEDLIDSEYYASPDVMKWFIEIYPFLKPEQRPIECVLEPGEVIFVPSGWWHQVSTFYHPIAHLAAGVEFGRDNCCHTKFLQSKKFQVCLWGLQTPCRVTVYSNIRCQDMIKRKSRTLRRQFKQAVQQHQPQLFAAYQGSVLNPFAAATNRFFLFRVSDNESSSSDSDSD